MFNISKMFKTRGINPLNGQEKKEIVRLFSQKEFCLYIVHILTNLNALNSYRKIRFNLEKFYEFKICKHC